MKLFKKNENKLHSAYALKQGSIATAITAAFIIVVVLLNILVTVLANKYPLNLDLTSAKDYSITEENVKYLKAVDKDVNIYVFATEEDFESGSFASYATSELNVYDSTGKYYLQTAHLVKKYSKYNKHLNVEFVDTTSDTATELKKKFSDYELNMGDILVECSFVSDGETLNRQKVLTFDDIYFLTDDSGYAAMGYSPYTISSNNIETALTSAIYHVTNEKIVKVGLPVNYCKPETASGLLASLKNYSYEIIEINTPALLDLDTELDALLLYDLKADLAANEIAAIEEFLDNGGKKEKALLYFASASSPALPNLEGLLQKWGIGFNSGLLYEASEENYLEKNPLLFGSLNTESEYTPGVNDNDYFYISGNNRPMEKLETAEDISVTTLLQTSESTFIKTADKKEIEAKSTPVVLASKQTKNKASSHIIAFSSVDFITTTYNNYSNVGNIPFIADALNFAVGREATDIQLSVKMVDPVFFSSQVNAQNSFAVFLIFVIIIPVAVIVLGIVFYVKRKNR